jgi:hypothetical protein
MKTALKYKNDEFLVTPLRNVLSVMGLQNLLETPKLLATAHKKTAINAKMISFRSCASNMY